MKIEKTAQTEKGDLPDLAPYWCLSDKCAQVAFISLYFTQKNLKASVMQKPLLQSSKKVFRVIIFIVAQQTSVRYYFR
ncbi:hypothetical protein HNQ56_004833 [Anaerotaenia torta]|uniref:hypothetical protein n=1 Tax=Anaerotaenia torta TaxID=433293 RepID=UPI003D1B4F48